MSPDIRTSATGSVAAAGTRRTCPGWTARWSPSPAPALDSGFAAAEGYARLGATVWMIGRNRERGERARDEIAARSGNDDIHVGVCDLSRLASIRSFAGRFPSRAERLDVLVNNAGVMTETRELSADGIELTLATNVIGPFALTTRLTRAAAAQRPGADHQRLLRWDVHAADQGRRSPEHARPFRRADGVRTQQARRGDPHRDLGADGSRAPA